MNKAMIALGIAGLLALPVGFASTLAEDVTVVTGHTVFVDVSGFDPNIALIAGLASSKVVWFNGVIVINNFDAGYVYAAEAGDCNPVKSDPDSWEFIDQDLSYRDPNQVFHVVSHYTYECGSLLSDGFKQDFGAPVNESVELFYAKQHVWVTPSHNRTFDQAAQAFYNWATGVDVSEFNGANVLDRLQGNDSATPNGDEHDGTGGDNTQEIRDGNSYNALTGGHTYNEADTPHEHNTGDVDLYFLKSDLGGNSTACVTQTCLDREAATIPSGY